MSVRTFSVWACLLVCMLFIVPPVEAADPWNRAIDPPLQFEVVRGVHLRARPAGGAAILVTLKPGERLQVTAVEKGWYLAQTESGQKGYIYKSFVRELSGGAPLVPQPEAQAEPLVRPEPTPAAEPIVQPEPAPAPPPAPEPTPAAPGGDPLLPAPPPAPQPAPAPEPVVQPEPQPAPAPEPVVQPAPAAPAVPATPSASGASAVAAATEGLDCKRIRFQPGAVSGAVERRLPDGERHCYQLAAQPNQWLEVWLAAAQDNAVFRIISPAGASVAADETHWLGRTESMGDFVIIVTPLGGQEASYNLKVQLK